VENPLLPGADSAIGAALNPTFPTGPANIIVPQADVGHGLSGSATDHTLVSASSLQASGGRVESSATNFASTHSQTGHSGIDKLTGLPTTPKVEIPGLSPTPKAGVLTAAPVSTVGGATAAPVSTVGGSVAAPVSTVGGSTVTPPSKGEISTVASAPKVGTFSTAAVSTVTPPSKGEISTVATFSKAETSTVTPPPVVATISSAATPVATNAPFSSSSSGSSGGASASNLTNSSGNSASGASSGVSGSTGSNLSVGAPVETATTPLSTLGIPTTPPSSKVETPTVATTGASGTGNVELPPIPRVEIPLIPPVGMPLKKPEVDLDVSLKPKGLLPPVEKTITIPITGHTPEGKAIYARTTLPDGVTRDEKTGVVNGILPPEGFYDVINKSLWFTGRVVDGSAGGNSGSNDISASGASGGVGGSSSGNSSSSGYSAVSAVGSALQPTTNSSPAVATGATGTNFSDDRGQTIILDTPITLSGQTLANVFNGGNPVVTQTNTDRGVSVTGGVSSPILPNSNTKPDLSTSAPFANLNPPSDQPSGLLKQPNSLVNLPVPGTTTSAIGKSFINADGQSITFDQPTALTNKALADLFNNGKPVVTQALADGTVRVVGDQTNTNSNSLYAPTTRTAAPYTAGYSQPIIDDKQLGLLKPANPGLVPIPKELLNPPSETQSALIPLVPFITPSTQTGKDATGIKFTDDRGQIITLSNATTLSGQTLGNLFNNGNSVVVQTKPNGDVSLVDSAKQATQNSYDALGRLVFKDPAPEPVQTAKPKPTNSPFEGTTATANGAPLANSQATSNSNPPSLESRIKDWQQSLGVTPDGIIGPETIAAAAKNGFDKGVDFVKNNSTLATKVVLSALGLGGTPDPNAPNQKQIDQATALKNIRDIVRSSPMNNQIDVLGITDTIELVSNTYKGFTNLTNEARDFWANEFAKGNGLAIVPGLVTTSLDSDHLPNTLLTLGGGAALGSAKAGKAILSSPVVQSGLAFITGLNGGQVITGKDLQGNELSGTDRFVKGASVALDLIGLGGVRNITLGKNPIADDAANLGVKAGNESLQPNIKEGTNLTGDDVINSNSVTVYRVEGTPNTRILIGEGGQVTVQGEKTLFLNFGSKTRAEEFLAKRLQQNMSDATVKQFEVPQSLLDDLRASAVPESMAKQFPNQPIIADPTKSADQFGLRPEQIEVLRGTIIQGSGKEGF
jgi:hypothetical protein